MHILPNNNENNLFQALGKNTTAQWLPVSLPGRPVASNSVQTQTVGLFFPSGKQISRKELEEEERVAVEKQMRDRKPLITAISPGKGKLNLNQIKIES